MPLIISASDPSEKLWGSLVKWPLRIDLAVIAVSLVTLLFSLSAGVFHVGIEYGRNHHGSGGGSNFEYTTSEIAARISLEVVVPLFAIGIASGNIWFFSCRTLAPGFAVANSVIMLCAWATMVYFWVFEVLGHHSLVSLYAVRVIKFIGCIVEVGLSILSIVYSAKAVHRLRKHGPTSGHVEPSAPYGVELESRRLSHASVADFNSGLRVHDDSGRRRTSLTPSFDVGKGPRVEPKEMF